MSRFIRVFACLLVSLFFAGAVHAAGYTCSTYKKYTSCNAGYYLNGTSAGNSCAACSEVKNTATVSSVSITGGKRNQTCTGYYTGGTAGSSGTGQCTGCSASTYSCACNTGYHVSGSGSSCTCVADCTNTCTSTSNTTSTQSCTATCSVANGTCTCQANAGSQTCNGKYTGGNNCTGSCSGCSSYGTCSGCGTQTISCNTGYYKNGSACSACTTVSLTENGTDTSGCTVTSQTVTVSITNGSYKQNQTRTGSRSMSRTCYRTGGAGGTSGSSACTGSGNCGAWGNYGSCSYTPWTNSGAAHSYSCNSGYYWNGSACAACEAGYYCPGFSNVNSPTSGYGRNSCTNAPANANYSGSATTNSCPWTCKAGYYGSSANGNTSCADCGSGNFCTGGTHRAACSTTLKSGSPTPTSYTSLSSGSWSDYNHAASANDCICNWNFSDETRTTYLNQQRCNLGPGGSNYTNYTACRTGYYAADPLNWGNWYTSCKACTNKPANSTFTSRGTPSVMYAVEDNCPWQCNANYYKDGSSCTACNVSFTDTGTCSRSEAITKGTKNYTGGSQTRTCYHTTSSAGSTASSACTGTANCTSYNACSGGTLSTVTCEAGYYKNASNTCTECEAGFYCAGGTWTASSSIAGRSNCTNAKDTNAEYYGTGTKSNACPIRCKANYYGNGSACTACSTVSFTDTGSCNRTASITGGSQSYTGGSQTRTCYRTTSSAGSTAASACTGSASCGSYGACSGGTLSSVTCNTGYTKNSSNTCTPNTYKVTLDNQSATTAGTTAYWYQYNTKGKCYYYTSDALSTCIAGTDGITITVPTRTGYTFGGYYTDKNGAGTQYINASGGTINNIYTVYASNVTLYAKWTVNTYSCAAGQYLNVTACKDCEAGYKCSAAYTYTYNGSVQGRTACSGAIEYQNSTKQTACKTVDDGYYKSSNSAQTQCPANYRDADGASAEGECRAYCSGGTRVASAKAACAGTTGYYIAAHYVKYGSTSAAATACSNKPANSGYTGYAATNACSWQCNAGHYLNGSSCTACAAGSYKEAAGNATSCSTCAAGTYNEGTANTGCSACPAGKYCTGGSNLTNCSAGTYRSATGGAKAADCTACTGRNSYSGAGASSCTTVTSGYYSTGCNSSNNNCTGQSACGGNAYYCSGGVRNSVSSGYYSTGGTETTRTGQSQCTGKTYCSGGVSQSCPSGYPNSDAGADAITKCYSGTKSRAWTGSQTACTKPSNCATVECNTCSNAACDYIAYVNAAGTGDGTIKSGCSTNAAACQQTVKSVTANANYYVNGTACSACNGVASGAYPLSDGGAIGSGYCYASKTNTGSQQDPTMPTGCAARNLTACSPGTCTWKDYYTATDTTCTPTNCTKGQTCTSASANYYLDSGTAKACSAFSNTYTKSDGGNITSAYCYVSKTNTGSQLNGSVPTNCNSVTEWNACTPGTCEWKDYSSATDTTCTPTNCTKTPKTVTASANSYVDGTACKTCSSLAGGLYPNSAAGNTGGAGVCKTNNLVGQYIATANANTATNCGAGKYKAAHQVAYGSTSSCDSCPAGLTTIGYGTGADEAGDCGHAMNVGGTKLYLRSEKRTTPSLNVKVGDKTFYGNMSTATKGKLRVKKDNVTYSVHDDSI